MSAALPTHHRGLRAVALIEAIKGAVVLVVGFGLLTLVGGNAERIAGQIVSRMHLNPAHHYPHIFIEAMHDVTDLQLRFLAALAALYSAVRFVEAYGLWRQRRCAEWLAALSGSIYVPAELFELWSHPGWLNLAALGINLGIVGYMVWLLTERRRLATQPDVASSPP